MKVLDRTILLEMIAGLASTLKDLGDRDGEAADLLRNDIRSTLYAAGDDLSRRASKLIKREWMTKPAAMMIAIGTLLKGDQIDLESVLAFLDSLGVDPAPDMPTRGHPLDDLNSWEIREDLSEK